MPWAVNDQGCCCDEGCEIYVPCCVNGIKANWGVKNSTSDPFEVGITLEAHIENLCCEVDPSCNGSVGLDWSWWEGGQKTRATVPTPNTRKVISSIETFVSGNNQVDWLNAGCLMGLTIDPSHVVCPCEFDAVANFKLEVTVFNCIEEDETWYLTPGAAMFFSLGQIPLSRESGQTPDAFNCEVPVIGYRIGKVGNIQPMTPELLDDNIPFLIAGEESVTLEWFFGYNPECVSCFDPETLEKPPPAVIEATPTTNFNEGTPKKDCQKNVCSNADVDEEPFRETCTKPDPEECQYEDCEECKSAPTSPTHTVDGEIVPFDPRTVACWNCFWLLVHQAGWDEPTTDPKQIYNAGVGADTECACGCPTCSDRRETINCVSRNIIGSGSSGGGSEKVCWQGPGGVSYWHGSIADGCERSFQFMDDFRYFGPAGSVSMAVDDPFDFDDDGGLTAQQVEDLTEFFNSLSPCDTYDIAWNTSEGPGPDQYTISMTIGPVMASRVVTPFFVRLAEAIVWIRDHGCA